MKQGRLFLLLLAVTAVVAQGLFVTPGVAAAHQPEEEYEVLFFHYTTGFRHEAIESAITAVEELGTEHGFTVTETQDPTVFNDETLSDYAAIVFFTDGENTLTTPQRNAFERYIHGGGGFVGLHSTANTDTADWPWWEDMFGGAFFDNHPPIQPATMQVEDNTHPATAHLGDTWEWPDDEWYNFTANPRDAGVHVLLTVDETTYDGGQMGSDHPIAWCSEFDGGRAFYTAIGHSASHYSDPDFRQHIAGAIEWAAGVVDGDCGEPREGVPTAAAFEKVALDDNTANPMKLDIAPDGRVFYTELGGTLKIYHPDTQAITVAGEIPVYRDQENGLLGIALDPGFEHNNWIYLYYSDPETMIVDGTTGGVQHLSRFTLDPVGETLDMDSEVVLLEVPHQRQECCHSSGHIDFDSQGNLYLSTGDDTNPFASSGFGPFDYRDGRQPWDAARSAGNTADLRGKILRINPIEEAQPGDTPGLGSTYTVPDDNLFTSGEYDHLFPNGEYDPELGRPEIYVMGLRNPFTLDVDQATDWLYFGLVGPDANPPGGSDPDRGPRGYDYWTQVREAGNYGWPFCVVSTEPYRHYDFATEESGEFYDCAGGPVNDSPNNTGISQLPPVENVPTVYYPYCNGQGGYTAPPPFPEVPCGPVAGGADYGTGRSAFVGDVYHFDPELEADGKFPAYYDGKPFVMEWERDFIATMDLDENGEYVPGSLEEQFYGFRFDDNLRLRKPHDMEFGPDGNLYLIEWGDEFNFAGGGVNPDSGLYRISYVKGGRTPAAEASATPETGQPPLEVSFSSEGTFDADGDEITYEWIFGDGTTSTEPNPTHTYTEAGVYTAQLVVTDVTDRSSSSNVTITVGNTRPEVTLEIPPHGKVFNWGDEIPYRVSVVDAEDGSTAEGTIDCADVSVQPGIFHDTGGAAHVHPGRSQSGCEGTITTEADSGHSGANVTTILTASYTDAGGHPDAQPLTGGVSHLLRTARMQGEHFTDSSGISTAAGNDPQGGGNAISGEDGAWASYDPVNLGDIDSLTLRASALDDTTVEIRRDGPDGELLGTADIPATADVERVPGQDGFGNAVHFNGTSANQYAELPEGIVSGLDSDFTIATWVNRTSTGQVWSRIFDFGTGTTVNMFLTPNAGGAPGMRYAITTGSNANEQQITYDQELPTGWHHVAVTLSGTTGTLWLDGEPVATNDNMTLHPADLGATDQNWLIRSQYTADPFLDATIDDFHIFDRALDQAEVQSLMAAPGGDVGGGNVAWYTFDEDGGGTAEDSSGQGNDANIVLSGTAASWVDVPVDIAATEGTFSLHLVFPGSPARVNWVDLGEVADGEQPPVCEAVTPVTDRDDFDGDSLDTDRWTVVEPDDNLTVADGELQIQTVLGRDFFADQGTLPNVVVQELPDGSWTATASMSWTPTQDFQNAGLVVWQDEDNYVKLGMVHSGDRAFELIKELDGTASFLGNSGLDAGFPDDFFVRYTYDGDTLEALYSADGESWTTVGTSDLSGLDAPTVGMYATNSTAAAATDPPLAGFDWFTLDYEETVEEQPTVSDDFSGDELDGCRWDRVVRFDEELLDVSDGQLHVETTSQDIFGAETGLPNIVLQDAPEGDWTIETKMNAQLARNFQNAGFMVHGDDDNYLKFNITATNQPGEERALVAEMGHEVGGSPQFPLVNDPVPSDNDEWWLRLTKEGTTYSGEWSVNGVDWTPLSGTRSIELQDPAVGLFATGSTAQQPGEEVTVSWDCFELAGEGEQVCPEPAVPPTVSAGVEPAEPDGANGWYVSPVTVTLSADDPDADIEYRIGDGDWTAYTEPFTLDEDGTYAVEYRATNAAGTSELGSVDIAVDQTAPETTATPDGELDGDVYLGPATLALQATDATSGVAETHYRFAGDSDHVVYTEPIPLEPAAEYTVEFRSVDTAGNTGDWQQVTVIVAETMVIVGGVDSGVANRTVASGTTINDLILDDQSWDNLGAFVRHVWEVTDQLADDGVITRREAGAIIRAAARSGIGLPGGRV